jgi:N-acetyl-anhydromuramyl-L-alanine amidase AmpD
MDIRVDYVTNNPCYRSGRTITPAGVMVHSTATPGIMAQNFRDRWDKAETQVCVHAFVDDTGAVQLLPWKHRAWHCGTGTSGKSANNTHISMELCEPEPLWLIYRRALTLRSPQMSGFDVARLQLELTRQACDPGLPDGFFGPKTVAALTDYQAANGLEADGVCGPKTWEVLNAPPESLTRFDAALTADYFARIYDNAASLCATLCTLYGIPASEVISHAEGYALGVASNHGDVGHWFPLHGVTMDDFRRSVRKKMEEGDFAGRVQKRFGLTDETLQYLRAYEYGDALLEKLATAK